MWIIVLIVILLSIVRNISSSFVPWTKKDTYNLSKNLNDYEDMNLLLENIEFFDIHISEPGYLKAMKKCIELKVGNCVAPFKPPRAYNYDFTSHERKQNLIESWKKKDDYVSWRRLYRCVKMRSSFARACLELRSFTKQLESPTEILRRIEYSISTIVATRKKSLLDNPAVIDCSISFEGTIIPTKIAGPIEGSSFLVLLETATEERPTENREYDQLSKRSSNSSGGAEKPPKKPKSKKHTVDKGKEILEEREILPENPKLKAITNDQFIRILEESFLDTKYPDRDEMNLKEPSNNPGTSELPESQIHLENKKKKVKYSEYPADISDVNFRKEKNKPKNYLPIDTIHPTKKNLLMEISEQLDEMNSQSQPMEIDGIYPTAKTGK